MNSRHRTGQRFRAQGLGTPPSTSSGRSTPFYEQHEFGSRQRSAEELESQNDEAIEGLSAKVKLLKDVTIAIGSEVRTSATQLSQMDDAFTETTGILSGTFHRLNRMSSRQGCRYLWFIIFLVVVVWIILITWWYRR